MPTLDRETAGLEAVPQNLRLPEGPAREDVLANGGTLDPGSGIEWVVADAWLSDVPRAAGTERLASWVEAARTAADA
jgi:hypothetical protein